MPQRLIPGQDFGRDPAEKRQIVRNLMFGKEPWRTRQPGDIELKAPKPATKRSMRKR